MKRGRPRIEKPGIDLGTPELQEKRQQNLTAETIDILLDTDIINQSQHWCAMHFRWLYTLRYGTPNARTTELLNIHSSVNIDDPIWRAEREEEYHTAVKKLHSYGVLDDVMEVLVYNPTIRLRQCYSIIPALRDGLEIMEEIWCKNAVTKPQEAVLEIEPL